LIRWLAKNRVTEGYGDEKKRGKKAEKDYVVK
jgi:hypothetical protein